MTEYLTKEQISLILKGEYKADFIEAFGIIHYHYEDCDEKDLVQTQKGGVRVHYKCKEAFDKMHEIALKEGIELEIISAYRSSKCQIEIFKHKFKDKEKVEGKKVKDTKELKKYKLLETNEKIPTLKEALKLVNGQVPLLISIKSGT